MASRQSHGENGQADAKRRFWFDPRFAIGVVLVVVSAASVVGIVLSVDRTVQVYAATGALHAGDRVTESDLESRFVRLDGVEGVYLTQGALPKEGVVIVRTVSAGELVPLAAVGQIVGERVASVVVSVSTQLPKSVAPTSVVDLWTASEVDSGVYGPPAVLVASATVVRVLESSGFIAGAQTVGVELLVPRDRIARVLEALANGDTMSLVPVSLSVVR